MLNMETINEYLIQNKNYYDRQNNSSILNKINAYGLNNAILDIFLKKNITGISNIRELIMILESGPNPKVDNIVFSAKRRYLQYLLTNYVTEPLELFYDAMNITDQEIDNASTRAMDMVSNYVINKSKANVIKR